MGPSMPQIYASDCGVFAVKYAVKLAWKLHTTGLQAVFDVGPNVYLADYIESSNLVPVPAHYKRGRNVDKEWKV